MFVRSTLHNMFASEKNKGKWKKKSVRKIYYKNSLIEDLKNDKHHLFISLYTNFGMKCTLKSLSQLKRIVISITRVQAY